MTSEENPGAPWWFQIVAIVAVLWNLMGLMAFTVQVAMDDATIAALPEGQRELMQTTPAWAIIAFAVAVLCGTAGSILLALKNKAAVAVLWLSLIGVLVQNTHSFLLSNALEVHGALAVVVAVAVIVIAIGLAVLSSRANRDGWLAK